MTPHPNTTRQRWSRQNASAAAALRHAPQNGHQLAHQHEVKSSPNMNNISLTNLNTNNVKNFATTNAPFDTRKGILNGLIIGDNFRDGLKDRGTLVPLPSPRMHGEGKMH